MGDPIYLKSGFARKNEVSLFVGYGNGSPSFTDIKVDLQFIRNQKNQELYGFHDIGISDFAKRHFEKDVKGTKITSHDSSKFMEEMLLNFDNHQEDLVDSDMPFCKYLVIENFTDARPGAVAITNENYQYLRSGYEARRDGELPVLSRWLELPIAPEKASHLVLVLYSKEQMDAETKERGENIAHVHKWNIVAILAQNSKDVEPMSPVTMMRNALGKEEGGNGFPLDRELYQKSVDFWSAHANVKY